MRIKNVKNKDEIISKSRYLLNNPQDYCGHYAELFGNQHDIMLEIGCGKGDFIIQNALNHPENNYIGIEKYDSVIARALQKVVDLQIPNLYFIMADALTVDEIFSHEITTLYLNFSDPWPKLRHQHRRLTSPIFLSKYANIFKGSKDIIMKTDNVSLYQYSLTELKEYGYTIIASTDDLYNSIYLTGNIPTEYETKFVNKNIKINYLHARIEL